MHALRASLAFVCLLGLIGCKSNGDEEIKEFVSIELKPMSDLNPNDRGEPTPVDVRIYKLKTPNKFTSASFEELWVDWEGVLGADAAENPEVVTLEPADENAKGIFKKLKMMGARYVGLMALYSGQSESGLEERKICVSAEVADGNRFEFTGHRIVLAGGGALEQGDGSSAEDDSGEGEGDDSGEGDDDGDGDDSGEGDDSGDGDGSGDGENNGE